MSTKIYQGGSWVEVGNILVPEMIVRVGNMSLTGLTDALVGHSYIAVNDTKTIVVPCIVFIGFNLTTSRTQAVHAFGNLQYGSTVLNPTNAVFGGAYTESVPVSYAWNAGESGLWLNFHSAFSPTRLVAFSTSVLFNRASLVTAGVLTA